MVNRLIHSLPCLEILDVSNTNLGPVEVDALTGSLDLPNLQIVKVGSYGNPLYSSPDLALVLVERLSSCCSKLVNVCFSGNNSLCLPELLPFPFYFYCNVPHVNFFFKLRPIELHVLLDDLMYMCSHSCTELYLTGCGIDDNTASILADGIKQCTNLEILDLSCNKICDEGAISLANSVKFWLKLRKLNLNLNKIGNLEAVALLSQAKCLIYLCGNNIITKHVSHSNVYFHSLTFSDYGIIGDSGVESLLHFIEESSVIDSELNTKTVQCYSSVHVLDISSNNISCHGAIALSSCFKYFPHLEELNVSCNKIWRDGACSIARHLSYYAAQHLCKLDISNNCLSSEGCIAIAKALHDCVNLSELYISDNSMDDSAAITLAKTLEYCNNVHKLDISCNIIRSKGACAIAAALCHCGHLETLILSQNMFREDGAYAIAKSFSHYAKSLHKFDIRYNNIGIEGATAIVNALKHCNHLEELIGRKKDDTIARSLHHYSKCLLRKKKT